MLKSRFLAFCWSFVCAYTICVHAETHVACSPIQGAEQLWAKPRLQFIVVGEMHGTNETPAIFKDLVCSARDGKRPIVVGVELRDQSAIDRYMESSREETARSELLTKPEWQKGSDGRASEAMLLLLRQLRALKLEGAISSVVAFSITRPGETAAQGEERMASALLAVPKQTPNALVIALTGNVHACKKTLAEIPYPLMASFLPSATTISLFVADIGGEAWTCQGDLCKPHPFGSSHRVQRGVDLKPALSPLPGYDGVLSTGLPATASRPAAQVLVNRD